MNLSDIDDQDIADCVFDCAVNCGVGVAGKFLQQGINSQINNSAANGLVVDGVVGADTLNAYLGCNKTELLNEIVELRVAYYNAIAAKHPSDGEFLKGWLNRLEASEIKVKEMIAAHPDPAKEGFIKSWWDKIFGSKKS